MRPLSYHRWSARKRWISLVALVFFFWLLWRGALLLNMYNEHGGPLPPERPGQRMAPVDGPTPPAG